MIPLSNGHKLEYVVASGSLGFDGRGWPWEKPLVMLGFIQPELFTVVLKTLTRQPREGNLKLHKPWECIQLIPGGSVNKVDLTNPGIEWWCNVVAPEVDFKKNHIVGSIFGDQQELVEMAEMFNAFDFVGIEVNDSCPNIDHTGQNAETIVSDVKAVKAVSRHPIIVKTSVAQDYIRISRNLIGIAEAVDLNAVPWEMVFPKKKSPLWKLQQRVGGGGGGVSGKPAQGYNWTAVKNLVKQREQGLPVIGPDIMEYNDLSYVRALGARAVSFGAIHLRTPWRPTSFVRKENKDGAWR